MNVRIGTAGYAYRGWVGSFYPPGLRPQELLAYYARQFPAVEINSSFYGVPTAANAERMARRTPEGFGFTLKVPKSASHGRSTDDLPAFRLAVDRIAAAGKLLGLVFQVPESFRDTPRNRAWLAFVGALLQPHRVAVEFRHRSWERPGLDEWMEQLGLDLVSVAVPEIASLFPNGLRIANRRVYVRMHSLISENWYGGGSGRYNFSFPDDVLRDWAGTLQSAAERGLADEGLVFFNNDGGGQAVANARRLGEILKEVAPAVRVVEPPLVPKEPSLFPEEWLVSGS
jgi:uncharacterized protein YecE (DUF72 family)